MVRPLLWLLGGVVLFLLAAAVLAPPELVLRALGLSVVAMVPAGAVVLIARDSRRRSDVYGGHTPQDATDHEEEH